MPRSTLGWLITTLALAPGPLSPQRSRASGATNPALFSELKWRNIGPNRGGRSIAAGGSPGRKNEYYFGATGGGLWKTSDGGTTWAPVTDGQIRSSSVGALAVAPSNPDVVYIGMGEAELRGNVMQGDGVYRSTDGGVRWSHAGLEQTHAIARVRVDPNNPDLVYVAALGHPYAPNEDRGIFRSTDGGTSWKKVLYRSDRAGAADLAMDPQNPRVLYATLWEVYRRPWILWSGGSASGLFKSTDGGETWTELTRNPGLPKGVVGKITVAVSGADSRRVWANVEAVDGGLYRSDDAGATWQLVNASRDLWQRAFYFMRMTTDPKDRETVYVLNFNLEKSIDGGKSFHAVDSPHADHHDLWIDPSDPDRMIEANDGGASVSVNGGRSWTRQDYPTAQMYRVTTTDEVPYHVCGAQQDNSTACVASDGGHLAPPDAQTGDWFYAIGGGESADIATKPGAPDIFFAGSTNTLTRYDRRTGQTRDVQPNPRIVMGEAASAMPERWNWTYPLAISRANPKALYAGSQHLWKSSDDGRSWRRISPDLTRADPATMGNSGGPIILDQDGPEIYATIFAIAPSRLDSNTVWVGSDDGLVHVTRNGGVAWKDVTPPDMPVNSRVSRIDASWHHRGTAYVAVDRHEMDDRAPYIWRTDDYGANWTRIVSGLGAEDFVRVVREDRVRAGLLFAGTEHGVYVSFDNGAAWRPLSLNLPDVQVSDLVVEARDLVIATHGRSFWTLDDISPLRQMTTAMLAGTGDSVTLLQPAKAIRRVYSASMYYHVASALDSVRLEITDGNGRLVHAFANAAGAPGLHRLSWNLRYPGATVFPGIVLEGGDPRRGPWAPPGRYRLTLLAHAGGRVLRSTQELELTRDARLTDVSDADLLAQFVLADQIRARESAANEAVIRIRELRQQIGMRWASDSLRVGPEVRRRFADAAEPLQAAISSVEQELYQVRNQSPKDKIAFPIRLNDRLTGLRANLETGDARPTAAYQRIFRELSGELQVQLDRLDVAFRRDLSRLNAVLSAAGLAPILVPGATPAS